MRTVCGLRATGQVVESMNFFAVLETMKNLQNLLEGFAKLEIVEVWDSD